MRREPGWAAQGPGQGNLGQTASGRTVGTGQAGENQRNAPGAVQETPGGAVAGGNAGLNKRSDQGPIDISSEGETTYAVTPQGRIFTETKNVNIQTTDASIFCDHAEYNLDTHEALLVGNVRIYRLDTTILAERAIYNFDSKGIRALDYQSSKVPYEVGGISVFSPGVGTLYSLRDSVFTTDDSSKPDYFLRSRRVRIYPDNRVIYVARPCMSDKRRCSIFRTSTNRSRCAERLYAFPGIFERVRRLPVDRCDLSHHRKTHRPGCGWITAPRAARAPV